MKFMKVNLKASQNYLVIVFKLELILVRIDKN
jgi:hypothetical protein